jgi:hypothetical protein
MFPPRFLAVAVSLTVASRVDRPDRSGLWRRMAMVVMAAMVCAARVVHLPAAERGNARRARILRPLRIEGGGP